MINEVSTAAQGGMRLLPAMGLSVLLHAGLFFTLHAPGLPLTGDAGNGITIHLVSLPGTHGGWQGALPESAVTSALPETRSHSAADSSRVPGPAQDSSDKDPSPSQEQDKVATLSRQAPASPARPHEAPKPRSISPQAKKNPTHAAPKPETNNTAKAEPEKSVQSVVLGYASKADASGPAGELFTNGVFSGPVSGDGAESRNLPATPKPAYPELARLRGQEGTVLLLADVDEKGAAKSVVVQRSSGHGLLDRAALDAVQRWRFKASHRAGSAASFQVLVPVEFRLHN